MRRWLQRVRGAIGMGILWALVCGVVGSVPRWLLGINTDVPIPIVAAVFGFLAGIAFSAVLVVAAGRRSFQQLSLPRFAAWGAAGGVVASVLFAGVTSLGWGVVPEIAPLFALASAVCASGTLILARGGAARPAIDEAGAEPEQLERGSGTLPRGEDDA